MSRLQSQVLRIASALPKGDPTRRQIIEAVAKSAGIWGESVPVKQLPPGVQRGLKSVGYGKRDISVTPGTKAHVSDAGGDGQRGFFLAVDILTGQVLKEEQGSWGGPNPWSRSEMDQADKDYPLRPGIAAIKGAKGGHTYAHITYHPDDKASFVPETASVAITPDEKKALNVISMVSSYRADGWRREELPGSYSVQNPIVQSLIAKGLVKTNAGGAMQLTPAGKNAR
jgi:hypothetical protein